jgi:hypothetical protein
MPVLARIITGASIFEVETDMNDRIDEALNRLRNAPANDRLDRLESAVWSRIEKQGVSDIFGGRALQVQLAVSCGALLLGVLVAQLAGVDLMPQPLSSEIIVLSDDSAVAPSVLLEGGI